MYKARDDENSLHKTLHYRRLREFVVDLAAYENINLEEYDLFSMRAYRVTGLSLQGKNVSTNVSNTGTCFVSNNHYNMIEIPRKENVNKARGEYLFLAQNTDFDYWIFGKMNLSYDHNETKSTGRLSERVKFTIYGRYKMTINQDRKIYFTKEQYGSQCNYSDINTEKYFDSFDIRKQAYNVNAKEIVNKICKRGHNNQFGITDKKPVEIYKKKNNKKRY